MPTPAAGFTTYTDDINDFSISVPDGWDIKPMEAMPGYTVFTCLSPCAGRNATLTVFETFTDHPNDVQAFYTEHVEPIFEVEGGYNLISKEGLTIDGIPAIKVIHSVTLSDESTIQGFGCYLTKQAVWIIEGYCDSTCWDTYKDTFDYTLNSFQLLY
jgi:hypothetical protein